MVTRLGASAVASESLAHKGQIRLAFLLERTLSLDVLRDLARRHGLSLKGFRIERAPANKLADLVATAETSVQEDACGLLLDAMTQTDTETVAEPAEQSVSAVVHRVVEQDLIRAKAEVAKTTEQAARSREREEECSRALTALRTELTQRDARVRQLERDLESTRSASASQLPDATPRIRELERDLETLGEAEVGLRRLLALRETRLRAAEELIAEMEPLVPKGRRRRRALAPVPTTPEKLRVPFFDAGYYRSLIGKDRSSVERATRAVFLLCAEGPSYPGLETKQIEGQDLWSVRASLKLRVYFRMREDGDLDILSLADREDQNTMLRRLKER